jgi:aspartyl protease family protein
MHDASNPQRRLGLVMIVAMWIVVLSLLVWFFQSLTGYWSNPNRELALSVGAEGARELALRRNRWGHYIASGTINGEPVVFMLDTGASDVSVPAGLAERLGLQRGRAMRYQTANGPVRAYVTTLDEVDLGGIRRRRVRASINPGMRGEEVLLGMSFLKHLEFTQRGDILTLRQLP